MSALAFFVRIINQLNEWIGRTVSWLTLGVVLVCFSVVVLRYVFNIGFVWMQDIYVWLHAIAFTLGAGYALLHDHHVRVDIFYRPASERYKAWLNLLGVLLLLLPFVTILIYWGWGYVVRSWMLAGAVAECRRHAWPLCHQKLPDRVRRPRGAPGPLDRGAQHSDPDRQQDAPVPARSPACRKHGRGLIPWTAS